MQKHPTYTAGQSVLLHFLRMTDSCTYLLLQKDGSSSGLCYHVPAATAATLPEHLHLQLQLSQVHPACIYVQLPEDALHHSHLTLTPEQLAAVDHSAPAPATENTALQLTFDF